MSGICQSIENYYRNVIATATFITDEHLHVVETRIEPISRFEFAASSTIAIIFIVQEIACFFFCCSQCGETRSFCKKLEDIVAYVIAVPLGSIGIFFPGVVNTYVTGIPTEGITTRR